MSNSSEALEQILQDKRGGVVLIVTTGGNGTLGTVEGVDEDIVTLTTTTTFLPSGTIVFAPVAFIPLAQITTILDDVNAAQFTAQVKPQS